MILTNEKSARLKKKRRRFSSFFPFSFFLLHSFFLFAPPPMPESSEQRPQRTENEGFFAKYGGQVLQMLMIWVAMRFVSGGNPAKLS